MDKSFARLISPKNIKMELIQIKKQKKKVKGELGFSVILIIILRIYL